MSKLNETDIQGFVLRGYNMPYARYSFLHFDSAAETRQLIDRLLGVITTGALWDANNKPKSTVNVAFSFKGLAALELPLATLVSFPVEFQMGMKARAGILGDTGRNSPEHWDEVWRTGEVHAWVGINAFTPETLEAQAAELLALVKEIGGVTVLASQDAGSIFRNGEVTLKEHFGFTDGFGNPDYLGVCRATQPGQGKRLEDGSWVPLATGELLLGYADEAGELPVAPIPHILGNNGTFMVYRKLHQNVGTFRRFLDHWGSRYGAGDDDAKEKLAAKIVGRWRDGTPIESSPDAMDFDMTQDPQRSTNFIYGEDGGGTRCPVGAHIRRVHPRDAFGFNGRLINRRRITRRGLPYGTFVYDDRLPTEEQAAAIDREERGVAFMALNASLSRQFEFVQQQWVGYGNDAHLGNDKDPLVGSHGPGSKCVIQGDTSASNPPLILTELPNFVELRGGEYFFLPSITALAMMGMQLVDPR